MHHPRQPLRARPCSFFVRSVGVLGQDGLLESRGLVSLVPLQHSAAILLDTMVARKTIVSLVGYLLIGWVVWIIVNFIEKTVSCVCSWSLLLSGIYQVHI